MKQVGLILVAFGTAVLIFLLYSYIKSQSRLLSPVPDSGGVKVIFISPTK